MDFIVTPSLSCYIFIMWRMFPSHSFQSAAQCVDGRARDRRAPEGDTLGEGGRCRVWGCCSAVGGWWWCHQCGTYGEDAYLYLLFHGHRVNRERLHSFMANWEWTNQVHAHFTTFYEHNLWKNNRLFENNIRDSYMFCLCLPQFQCWSQTEFDVSSLLTPLYHQPET